METTKRRPRVFIYHVQADWEVVRTLLERLTYNGVEAVLLGEIAEAANAVETESGVREQDAALRIVRTVDVVIFCLSPEFNKMDSLKKLEWRPILEAALKKPQGDLYVVTLGLHPSEIPEGLKRWQLVKLYEQSGYEALMHALQLRADKLGAQLVPTEDWKTSFYEIQPEAELNEEAKQPPSRKPFPMWVLVIVMIIFLGTWLFRSTPGVDPFLQTQTAESVQLLARRATQNIVAQDTQQAGTSTAEAIAAAERRIQTEAYLTSVPVVKTATALQALITPTLTLTVVTIPTQIIDTGNILMALVPEGSFIMGRDGDTNANPAHVVRLPAYYIDLYEVTNANYQACVQAGACQPPVVTASQTHEDYYTNYTDYPIVNVDWFMAKNYCQWRGARLPTEAEWEKTARGPAGVLHPWGDDTGCFFANHNNCVGDTSSVDKYIIGRSLYGIFNLAGNVMEWTSSLFMDYPYDATDGREDPASTLPRVLRGGSWDSLPSDILTYNRLSLDPSTVSNEIGFRCVKSVGQ